MCMTAADNTRSFAFYRFTERTNVFRRCPATTADDVQPTLIDKIKQFFGEAEWCLMIMALFIRKPCIWITTNASDSERCKCANVITHEFRTCCTVQPNRNWVQVLNGNIECVNGLTGKRCPHRFNRAADHNWNI